ncbi:uracil phosphoribosyltransferase-domain-containing protein [Plectosphaerella cucumerina]|uniref:uracil phosphoribosyltransferase n=1 Tax=Plectosphaerella cucumerina TaxID=40658 RepID=A0A8K0X467_9PEZI|nr:uracil phosphoribosyltransferase-domain-containing protein [Plectosphaerella cucumerina]
MANVTICSDPAYASVLTELRDRSLKPTAVRKIVSKLTAILSKDATAKEPLQPDEQVAIIVVLRSGLAMTEAFVDSLPEDANTVIYHLGLFREKHTLQPVEYYNKLPPKNPKIKRAFILDPLIATGGTAQAAISILKDWGVESVSFYSILASESGIQSAALAWPEGSSFVVGHVDPELDAKGYVQPGVGDIGDRLFGTQLD